MSAPLHLTPAEVGALAEFLRGLSELSATTGVHVGAYGPVEIVAAEDAGTVRISWDQQAKHYFLDDLVGN